MKRQTREAKTMAAARASRRGSTYPTETKTKAIAMYAELGNVAEVARQMELPEATVRVWVNEAKKTDAFAEYQRLKKEEFIADASRIIKKGTKLIEKQLDSALENSEKFEKLISSIMADGELNVKDKKDLVSAIRQMELKNPRDLAVTVGTIYDKRALSTGESTENATVRVETYLDQCKGKEF